MSAHSFRSFLFALNCIFLFAIPQLPAQDFQWARRLGSASGSEYTLAMQVDAAGNVYTTGYFQDTCDFDPDTTAVYNLISAGFADIFISKLDASGNFVYAKRIGSTHDDMAYSMVLDDNGGVIIGGHFRYSVDFDPDTANVLLLNTGTSQNMFLLKLDASGNLVWVKQFTSDFSVLSQDLATDAAGNIYATGAFYNTTDFDPGPGVDTVTSLGLGDVYVMKLDPGGNLLWVRTAGGSETSNGQSLDVDSAGFVYVTGYFEADIDFIAGPGSLTYNTSGIYYDGFIWKLDPNGGLEFAFPIGGNELDQCHAITVDPAGYIYTLGNFKGTVDFDPDASNTYYYSSYNNTYDGFILKTDLDGNLVWVKHFSGDINEWFNNAAVSPSGDLYASGRFHGTLDVDPSAANYPLVSGGGTDGFLLRLDGGGNLEWSGQVSGNFGQDLNTFALHGPDTIYAAGYFWGPSDLDPGPGNFPITAYGETDAYILRLGATATGISISETLSESSFSVYPNPSEGVFRFSNEIQDFRIYNSLGMLVYQHNGNAEKIDLFGFPEGIYLLKIDDGRTAKLLKN